MNPLPPLLLKGDALAELARIPDDSIDSVVTDPPYGLANTDPAHVVEALTKWATGDREFIPEGRGFMGKAWDAFVPPPAVWDECLRVLKPGGHLLAFAGSRTFDLMTLSIRFAGFDIRDSIAWLYGSGFPKSMDVSKAIDKADRGVPQGGSDPTSPHHGQYKTTRTEGKRWDTDSGQSYGAGGSAFLTSTATERTTAPSTPPTPETSAAAAGGSPRATPGATALSNDAHAWQGWGTALKPAFEPIVVARKPFPNTVAANVLAHGTGALNIDATRVAASDPEAYAAKGASVVGLDSNRTGGTHGEWQGARTDSTSAAGRWPANVILDESQAATFDESRFFYVAKAPKSERPVVDGVAHPTVKPLTLMRQLVKLVTPPEGVVLEPFAGSGTTLEAAYLEGFESIGIEMTPDYWPLIQARIERITS